MSTRPAELNLSNWRQPGNTRWAFHHVREIIASEEICRSYEERGYLVFEDPTRAITAIQALVQFGRSFAQCTYKDGSSNLLGQPQDLASNPF